MDPNTRFISGHANKQMQQYKQISTTTAQSVYFHAFIPVGGNATLTTLTDIAGNDAKTYNESGIYYQDQLYTGSFSAIAMATGTELLLYLSEQ